jgi:hypothetical protein
MKCLGAGKKRNKRTLPTAGHSIKSINLADKIPSGDFAL